MIKQYSASVTTLGTAGNSSGSGVTPHIEGRIVAVHIDYVNQPGTTDVVVQCKGAPVQPILTVNNANTDKWFYPRVLMDDQSGSDLTAIYEPVPVYDVIEVSVTGGDNNGVVNITILVED